MAKKPFLLELGIVIHVWIDDNPRAVEESALQIWGRVHPEGHTETVREAEGLAAEGEHVNAN